MSADPAGVTLTTGSSDLNTSTLGGDIVTFADSPALISR
jgi:hypothetical protein